MPLLCAALLAIALAVSHPAHADFTGRVVRVSDGDTLDVLVKGRAVRVRLARIDAPEKKQAFGWQAHQTLYSLTFHKNVLVIEAGHDHYGRTVGTIYLGRINVNQELVRRGMAWADRYHSGNPALLHIEAEARRQKRGLWANPSPEPPWNFRKRKNGDRRNWKNGNRPNAVHLAK
ncbi:putative endonuclease [Betaproteobacteria bacterium]|nr:putative endonuclease [Betaproteobacteria bacterium]